MEHKVNAWRWSVSELPLLGPSCTLPAELMKMGLFPLILKAPLELSVA